MIFQWLSIEAWNYLENQAPHAVPFFNDLVAFAIGAICQYYLELHILEPDTGVVNNSSMQYTADLL